VTVTFVAYNPRPDPPAGPPTSRTGDPLTGVNDPASYPGVDLSHSSHHGRGGSNGGGDQQGDDSQGSDSQGNGDGQ